MLLWLRQVKQHLLETGSSFGCGLKSGGRSFALGSGEAGVHSQLARGAFGTGPLEGQVPTEEGVLGEIYAW